MAILIASLASLASPRAADAAEVLWASPFGPPSHLLNTQVLAKWADAVDRSTMGRVKVDLLGKAVAPPAGILDAIRADEADVSIVSNGAAGTPLPLNALVEFAAQTPDAERSSVAYQHVVSRHPSLTGEFADVEVVAVFTHGPGALLMAKRGVATGDTMDRLTLHAGGTGAAGIVRAVGAAAVVAPGPAAKQLLVERRVDGTMTALETLDGFALAPEVDEIIVMPGGFYCAGFSLVVNRARWSSLTDDDQAAIRRVSGEFLARLAGQAWDAADRAALTGARQRGIAVVTVPVPLAARIRAASASREAQWIADLGPRASDGRDALAEYRAELQVP